MDNVLLTGSGRLGGLGFEVGRALGLLQKKDTKEKMFHIILSGRNEENLQKCVQSLQEEGISASFIMLDITDIKSVENAKKTLETQFLKLNILINNAALMRAGSTFWAMDLEEMQSVLTTNLMGTWRISQALLPLLKPHKQSIKRPLSIQKSLISQAVLGV